MRGRAVRRVLAITTVIATSAATKQSRSLLGQANDLWIASLSLAMTEAMAFARSSLRAAWSARLRARPLIRRCFATPPSPARGEGAASPPRALLAPDSRGGRGRLARLRQAAAGRLAQSMRRRAGAAARRSGRRQVGDLAVAGPAQRQHGGEGRGPAGQRRPCRGGAQLPPRSRPGRPVHRPGVDRAAEAGRRAGRRSRRAADARRRAPRRSATSPPRSANPNAARR